MLEMNGRAPILYRLTEEQQRLVGNEQMKLIKVRTGSLKNAVELVEGHRLLHELGLLDEAVAVVDAQVRGIEISHLAKVSRTAAVDWHEVGQA